jgi:hypothetical protein
VERKARLALQLRQPPVLQPHVVAKSLRSPGSIVEVVYADDRVAVGQQELGDFGESVAEYRQAKTSAAKLDSAGWYGIIEVLTT